jgi:hypothetical protein
MTQGPKQTWSISSVGTRITYTPHTKALSQFSTVLHKPHMDSPCLGTELRDKRAANDGLLWYGLN